MKTLFQRSFTMVERKVGTGKRNVIRDERGRDEIRFHAFNGFVEWYHLGWGNVPLPPFPWIDSSLFILFLLLSRKPTLSEMGYSRFKLISWTLVIALSIFIKNELFCELIGFKYRKLIKKCQSLKNIDWILGCIKGSSEKMFLYVNKNTYGKPTNLKRLFKIISENINNSCP